jgi:predicted ATPase
MQERAEDLVGLASQEGFAYWAAQATMWGGWTLTARGQYAEGIAQIRQGVSARHATGASLCRTSHFALLAEVYGKAGQVEEGLRIVAEGLAMVDTTGERVYEAELYRLKGELLLQRAPSDAPQAERCFRKALAIARRRQAKSWELRAAVSLSRLWQRQGRFATAYTGLAEVYNGFTEGLDTADLRAAKALLDAATAEPDQAGLGPTGSDVGAQDSQQLDREDVNVRLPLRDETLGPPTASRPGS